MTTPLRRISAVPLMTAAGIATAQAAPEAHTYSFDVTWDGGPIADWVGEVTLTFDPAVNGGGYATGYSSNRPEYGSLIGFRYTASNHFIDLGPSCSPGFGCGVTSSTYAMFISFSLGLGLDHPVFVDGNVSAPGFGIYPDLLAASSVSAVPTPATAGLLALAAGTVVGLRRRRGRAAGC